MSILKNLPLYPIRKVGLLIGTEVARSEVVFVGDTRTLCSLPDNFQKRNKIMLWTIAVILIILWLLGMVTAYTIGGFIHIMLVVAIIAILIRVIRGRRVLD